MFRSIASALLLTAGLTAMTGAVAAVKTPVEQDQLRIHTSLPAKASDSLFSYTVEWRIDDGERYHSTGLSFLNAGKVDAANPGAITKKLVTAIKDGMIQLDPGWRGINVNQTADQPELVISNRQGYSVTTVTVRDYSNQPLSFDLVNKSFAADGVQLAVDVVLAADVEYLDNFSATKSKLASQGLIEIALDGQSPVQIRTDGKTTAQIEAEIARHLKVAKLSNQPLFPNLVSSDKRNNKPFDNSEVQLLNLSAKSLSINVTDPALGVLVKFKFKDDNHASVKVAEPRSLLVLLGVLVALLIGWQWHKKRKA